MTCVCLSIVRSRSIHMNELKWMRSRNNTQLKLQSLLFCFGTNVTRYVIVIVRNIKSNRQQPQSFKGYVTKPFVPNIKTQPLKGLITQNFMICTITDKPLHLSTLLVKRSSNFTPFNRLLSKMYSPKASYQCLMASSEKGPAKCKNPQRKPLCNATDGSVS